MKRMAVVAAAAALLLGGCGGDGLGNADVADVDGRAVSSDSYESLVQALGALGDQFSQFAVDPQTGTLSAETGRGLLSTIVRDVASTEFLAAADEAITEEDRAAILDTLAEDDPARQLPADVLDLLVDAQAGGTARARVAPDAAELAARYDESPAATGLMCVRHIVVETEAAAQSVLDELAAGADFSALAASESVEPAAVETGGALTGQDGGACIPLSQAAQGFDPLFVAGAVEARPGAAVGPVESSFGWHVIEARPWDEVESSATALYQQAGGELAFQGYLATADIEIDPRYGRWDGSTGTVVAL